MPQRKIGRREFLKLAIAAAGAAGLSHFRILNIGGADVAYARECEVGSGEDPDICDAGSVDWCIPLPDGDPDLCPDPGPQPSDMCPDNSQLGGVDICQPAPPESEPDACAPWVTTFADPDTACEPAYNDPDVCYSSPQWGDPDVCDPTSSPPEPDACGSEIPDICNPPADPDECENGQIGDTCTPAGDPDICPDGAGGDDDQCDPAQNDQDICPEPFGGAGDTCQPPTDPDVCCPTYTPDVCEPPATPADEPNPVTVSSAGAESASSVLPTLGGVAAALGAAALWLRHRLRPEKPEEPDTV